MLLEVECSHIPFLCLVLLMGSATGQVPAFHCSKNGSAVTVSGETEGDIYTRYEGDIHYQNNQNCEWIIDAGEGRRISMSVVSSDLQWAPAVAICHGYDHVSIKDVSKETVEDGGGTVRGNSDSDESIVLIWCGQTVPVGAVSRGRYLRAQFMSDNNNPYQYAGVHLKFETFASTDCAPSWAAPPGSDVCFRLIGTAMDWSAAQKECNAEKSNLASFTSEEELNFVVQTYGSAAYDLTTWIGLNDKKSPGSYRWVDEHAFSVNRFRPGHQPDKYRRCVTLRFQSQEYYIQDCIGYKSRPLCKANKGRQTPLFAVPQESNNAGNVTPTNHLVVIGVSVGIFLIFVIIGIILCCYFRAKPRAAEHRQPKNQTDTTANRDTPTSHYVMNSAMAASNVPDGRLRVERNAVYYSNALGPKTAAVGPRTAVDYTNTAVDYTNTAVDYTNTAVDYTNTAVDYTNTAVRGPTEADFGPMGSHPISRMSSAVDSSAPFSQAAISDPSSHMIAPTTFGTGFRPRYKFQLQAIKISENSTAELTLRIK